MTVDEIFAPSSSGNTYSIQDVLSAVGGQYQPSRTVAPQRSQSIDEILASLSGQIPASASPTPVGAARYITGNTQGLMPESKFSYTPAAFDKEALTAKYQANQVAYANELMARGYSQQQAMEEAGLGQTAGPLVGSYLGQEFGPIGSFVGNKLGGAVGSVVDDILDW